MTTTMEPEYRKLELDSSNELIESDSCRVLGRYPEAAFHAREAGRARLRMGEMAFKAERFTEAAEDWLSAAECFARATAPREVGICLDLVRRLDADSRLPENRKDLRAALQAREQQARHLDAAAQRVLRSFAQLGLPVDAGDPRALDFWLGHSRDLPGYPLLHYAIYRQAALLGRDELAARHLTWAAAFDPDNPNYAALLGYLFLQLHNPARAVEVGRHFLDAHPSAPAPVRVMLANAYTATTGGRVPDHSQAIEVLQPLVRDPGVEPRHRIAAVGLMAALFYELGRDREFHAQLAEVDRLTETVLAHEVLHLVAEFRSVLSRPGADGRGHAVGHRPALSDTDRFKILSVTKQLSPPSVSLAA